MTILATYTGAEVTLYVAALVTVISSVGAVIVTTVNGIRQGRQNDKLTSIEAKVNGAHTEQQRENKALQDKINDLVASLAEKKEAAALLAQQQALSHLPPPLAQGQIPEVIIANPPSNPVPTVLTKKP